MNKEIELLNKKIEAQDKIINTQALEIAKLNKQLENENKVVEEYLKLENKIDKAIEYIEKFIPIDIDTIILSERQREYLLEILGDKENE